MNMIKPDDPLRFVIAGRLARDTILPISGPPQIDVFGGNLAYAAVGLALWGEKAGLLANIDPAYPVTWFERFKHLGFELTGIKVSKNILDNRRFLAHEDLVKTHYHDPIRHFAERGLVFPKNLLGYRPPDFNQAENNPPTNAGIQIMDIPSSYFDAGSVHICPLDFNSHIALPSIFRQHQASTVTLASSPTYMDPAFWESLPSLLSDLTAFITLEGEARHLFFGRQTDLWEIAETLSQLGPEFIIIQTETAGYYLFDRTNDKRWIIPQYQANIVDPTGTGDAFAGGFLAGYREHYDPVEAGLMGSIAASVVVEGSGVYFGVDALPELVEARRLALRDLIRQV